MSVNRGRRLHHCDTCTCRAEPDPVNRCNVVAYGCEGEEADRVTECYSCGLDVCRGPECSALVLYRYPHRWVRMCASCVVDRTTWGDVGALSLGAAAMVSAEGLDVTVPVRFMSRERQEQSV